MLFEAGAVARLGTVGEGTTVSDHEPDEQEREMSINASLACFEHGGREINLIDTPGEPSFVADAIAALCVADAAVVVVNGVMGVEVNTERLWQRADAEGLARLVFVNMLDRERADFFHTLDSLKAAFGPHVVATEIPLGVEGEVSGVIDLIDQEAFAYEGTGPGAAEEVEIPAGQRAQAEQYREKLMDEVAENSDQLMERYLEGEEIEHDEIVRVLKQGVTAGRIFPVTCGVATRNLGTGRLLEALVEDLPSPAMRGAVAASGPGGEPIEIEPDEDGPLVAYVFKTLADPYTGRVNLFRVYRGTLRLGFTGGQCDPCAEGADRPARPAARRRAGGDGRARRGRYRRGREAEADPRRRRALRRRRGGRLRAARPARPGDGIRLRAGVEGR